MDKLTKLKDRARTLRSLLEHYAKVDDDAEMVLGFMTPIFKEIEAGKITPPHDFRQRWYFGTESSLIKYDDLIEAAALYARVLEDWDHPIP